MTEHRTFDLAYWINEREAIRLRREAGLRPPFSPDPHMANVRYCNVHREDDKVTKWIAENWRNPNAEDPNLTLGMVTARMINWPNTLDAINYPTAGCDLDRWMKLSKNYIRICREQEQKAWTSAYTISTCGRRMLKEDYVFDHVLAQVAKVDWNQAFSICRHRHPLDFAHRRLMEVDGLGSFLAAQVVADLKNTPGHPLSRATDFWTWSAPGPGSLRGLAAYYRAPVTTSQYHRAIDMCYTEVMPLVEQVGVIHMQDFQNCLCEFSKYIRVKDGDGRVRNKYTAG